MASMQAPKMDTYWRLNTYDSSSVEFLRKRLKSAGWKSEAGFCKFSLIDQVHRLERGLLCYDNCTTVELVQFARDRQFEIQDAENEERKRLIVKLEDDDDEATFEKMFDLPAEMRNRIYEAYLAEFPKGLDCPSQPPLARTNRQMRAEVLPLFYSEKTFVIHLTQRFDEDGPVTPLILDLPLRVHAFVNSLQLKYASEWMRRIEFCLSMSGDRASSWASFILHKKKNGRWAVSSLFPPEPEEDEMYEIASDLPLDPFFIYNYRAVLEESMRYHSLYQIWRFQA